MSENVPFGDEWKAEVMRLKKSEIIDILAKALREDASRALLAVDRVSICPVCGGELIILSNWK